MRDKRTKRIITGIILSLLVVGIAIFVVPPILHGINEPQHNGTRLSVLFKEAYLAGSADGIYWKQWKASTNLPPDPAMAKAAAAVDAIMEIGEPAAPYLGRWLLARPTSVHKWYRDFYPMLPSLIPNSIYRHLPSPLDPDLMRWTADFLLKQLKAKAAPALPVLIKNLRNGDPREKHEAINIIREMGPVATNTIPALVAITKGPDAYLSIMAAEALFRLDPSLDPIYIPVLHAGLKNEDAPTRYLAADFYWQITHDASLTIPALTHLLDHPQLGVGCYHKLGMIGPEAHSAMPLLVTGLSASDHRIRAAAAGAIQRIDPTYETHKIAEILKGSKETFVYPAK